MTVIKIEPDAPGGVRILLGEATTLDATGRAPDKPLLRVAADGIHLEDVLIVDRQVGKLYAEAFRRPVRAAITRHHRRIRRAAIILGALAGATIATRQAARS